MSNNVGWITEKLPRIIGEEITITSPDKFDIISGEPDVGFIVYDDDGTIGICSQFTRDESGNPSYKIKTTSLNTEIDIQNILSKNY